VIMADTALPPSTVEVPTEVTTGAQWRQARPARLYAGVLDGELTDAADETARAYPIAVQLLGSIPVPDGRLVTCDPCITAADEPALSREVPVGEHPVFVALASIAADHQRVIAAVVACGAGPITSWELGTTARDKPILGGVGEYTGFGVDSGTACFLSPSALPALIEVLCEDDGRQEDPITGELHPGKYVLAAPRPGALAVAAFESGWGDGTYPTWFGLAADHSPVVAMIDLMLFADPFTSDLGGDEAAAEPQPTGERGFWKRLSGRR